MKITLDRRILTDALSLVNHAVPAKSTRINLEAILLTPENGDITLAGYNFQMGIIKTVPTIELTDPFPVMLPSRLFLDTVRRLRGDSLTIEVDSDLNTTISSGRTVARIKAEPGETFPKLPQVEENGTISVKSDTLKSMIDETLYAVSTNENKPIHTGAKFELEGDILRVIALDGYRLALRKETVTSEGKPRGSFVVPGITLKELRNILPDGDESVTITPNRQYGRFEFADTTVLTTILEGSFLDFRKAVPDDMTIHIALDRDTLSAALERVSVVITDKFKCPVRCSFTGETLRLTCLTSLGSVVDEIAAPDIGEPLEIGFNTRYLLEALRACPEGDNMFELKGPLSPVIIRPMEGDSFLHMVLPVRLSASPEDDAQ